MEVEKIGTLEFPDGTETSVIDATVKKLVGGNDKRGIKSVVWPIKQVGKVYKEEATEGLESMRKALEEPTGRSLIGGLIGALQYAGSPLTALVRGLAADPTEEVLKGVGVPDEYAELAGDVVETGAYFVPYSKAVQTAIITKKALETTKAAAAAKKTATREMHKAKGKLEFPKELPDDVVSDAVMPISEANQKVLKESVIDDVVTTLKEPVSTTFGSSQKRITQEIVDYITQNPDEILKTAEKYKLTPQQLAAQMKETMTLAGRDLGRMGRLAKEIRQKFETPYMKKLSDYMDDEIADIPAMDKFGAKFKTVENVRRAALVSQVATTMRNIISQGGRVSIGTVDDAFQGAANAFLKSTGEGTLSSVKSTLRGFGEGLDLLMATTNRLRPKSRAKLVELLGSANALDAKAKMFTSPIQDVVLTGTIAKRLNTLNTMQEYFFRNISFEAKLRNLAKKGGIDFKKLGPDDIPESMYDEAAEYALDMTFAANPKSTFGKDWVKAMSHPVLTALINPFPRFLWGNALPFLKRYSPIGFLEAAKPSVVADIVEGNTEKFAKAISEATIGTLMLNAASHVRNSEYAGEKWYEIKSGDKTIDTRAFAPFSTYLFVAEALQSPERIKPADFGSALLSLNRIGGTGLVLTDILRGTDVATTKDTLERLAGAYISGFTVPARTIKDVYSGLDEDEAIYRDIRDSEFFGPTARNIPGLSQMYPEMRSPLRVGDVKAETPVMRQFTGLSARTKNALEKEVDSIQLPPRTIYPGTGVPEADRKVSEIMAPVLEKAFPLLRAKTDYDNLDDTTKRIILTELFRDAKKAAKSQLLRENPALALKIKIEDIPKAYMDLIKRKGLEVQ